MGRLLPSSEEMDPPERDPRVLGVDSDDADDIMSALSSETARNILAALHNNPAAPSDLTSEVDTSLQNIQYHLQNLNEAGLADVVDTHYSEKGREMKVYAANDNPIILFGSEEQSEN
ncbi:MAG: ArsR/SmtB family transcription factor, partial [Halobacteriaceae archaeon]